jgi:uncharacterized protein (UPF0332 family)
MQPQLPQEAMERTLKYFLDTWISPEVQRRGESKQLPDGFVVNMAQIIFDFGSIHPVIRLNDEVKAVVKVKKYRREMRPGEAIYASDIEEIGDILLTDNDPNSAHVTIIFMPDGAVCSFNFNYNATMVAETLGAASKFISGAEDSLKKKHLRPFVESLWSAMELLAKASLLWAPDQSLLTNKSHSHIHQKINLSGKRGLVDEKWVKVHNKLENLRGPARYLAKPFVLTETTAGEMLGHAKDFYEFVKSRNPVREPGAMSIN